MEDHVRVITEALSVDKHLERQRHLLVPKTLSEEAFFRNYFHHLHALARRRSRAASSSPLVTSEVHSEPASEASSSVNVAAPSPPPEEKFERGDSPPRSRRASDREVRAVRAPSTRWTPSKSCAESWRGSNHDSDAGPVAG